MLISIGKRSSKNLQASQKSFSIDKEDSFKSPHQVRTSHKKKTRSKIISIKPKTKSDIDNSDCLSNRDILDDFETILSSEINDFKMINYDRVSPNLIQKFSKCFDKIIQY